MSQQNINQYVFNKWKLNPSWNNLDMSLASDETDFNEEVVFSTQLIGINNGNRLPIYFDLNNSNSSQKPTLNYGDYLTGNTLVSLNYYNPNNENLSCFTGDSLCDIGLTGIDNGLVPEMSGETIYFSMGLYTGTTKWDRYHFDRRTKLIPIKSYTTNTNRFSGNTKETIYNIVSKTGDTTGVYNQLYGGFNQGFFKLFGYDYETFPNRCNKGWSVEMLLRARQEDQFYPTSAETTLNLTYSGNENTFFYLGTRAENKFYHHASGSPESDSGYTRVTEVLSECLKTCACSNSGVTNSRCLDDIYEPLVYTSQHNVSCNCGCSETTISNPDKDPLFDSMSNTFSLRLSGDPKNPIICIKVLKFTGGCETTGSCETTGITYTTGYTISEYCSTKRVFEYCANNTDYINKEHWFLIDCVWERNSYFDTCDLLYRGGLDSITKFYYVNSLAGNAVSLITVPYTQSGATPAEQVEVVNLNEEWLIEKDYRLGSLKIYINGRLIYVINGFEEVIPRGLNTEKEKQIGVPFNLSWGGGTQGLRESLTFEECPTSLTGLTYQQDPECMPNQTLSGTSLSALTTNIYIEPQFGGSFDGAISQFRMYTEPLTYPEVVHNFDILKGQWELFDYKCPSCSDIVINDIIGTQSGTDIIFSSEFFSGNTFNLYYYKDSGEPRYVVTENETFPYTMDTTLVPNCCGNNFYFYIIELDQTFLYT